MNFIDRFRLALSALRGKAMLDLHPEIQDRYHLFSSLQGDIPSTTGSYSYLQAIADYELHVWVRKAVLVIANNLAALPVQIVRGEEPVASHPLLDLLTNVNDTMSSQDLWLQWVVDMLLGGEEAWELVKSGNGKYQEIWPRQPHMLNILPDKAGRRYYRVAEYRIDDHIADSYTLPPDELLHFKFYNPRNPWRGISAISAAREGIVIDQFAQAWSRNFFYNSARPDYAVIAPQGMTPSERETLEKMLAAKFGGAARAHKPIVLEEGVSDIKVFSFPPKDMEWVEQRKMSREEIGAIFGVPDEIMGWGRDTYENFATAERVLWTLTICPLAAHRDTQMTEYFRRVGALGANEFVATDLSGVDALREGDSEKWTREQGQLQLGVVTVNEWRIQNGYKPFPAGDTGRVPLLDTVGGIQGSIGILQAVATGIMTRESAVQLFILFFGLEKAEADAMVGDIQLLPPAPPPQVAPPGGEEPVRYLPAPKVKGAVWEVVKAPEFGSQEHKDLWEAKDARLDTHRREMMKLLARELERQRRAVIGALQGERAITGNGHLAVKQSAADVFDPEEEADAFLEEFRPVVTAALRTAGQEALADIGLGIRFDLSRPEVRAALKLILGEFAEKVNDTTYNELVSLFQQAEADGVGTLELIDRLDNYFEGRKSEASLERIARTTMTAASGAGDMTAWEQSGVVEEREWLSALDERTRDTHVAAHGQRVGLDEALTVGDAILD